jgi:hypothetical protein
MNIKDESGRLGRWPLYIQSLDMNIMHRPGRIHSNVDILSRPVLDVNLIATFLQKISIITFFHYQIRNSLSKRYNKKNSYM